MGVVAWVFVFLGGFVAFFGVLLLILDHAEQNSRADAFLVSGTLILIAGLFLVFGYELGDGRAEHHPSEGVYQAVTNCQDDSGKNTFKCLVRENEQDNEIFVVVNVYNVDTIARGEWLRLVKQDNGWYDVFRVNLENPK